MTPFQRLRLIREGGYVTRYHKEPFWIGERQSVAEHSYFMAQIALAITEDSCSLMERHRILVACLHHDLGEQHTGDVPADIRWKLGHQFENALEKEEYKARDLIGCTSYLTSRELQFLEAADCLEALFTILEQILLGNRFLVRAAERLIKRNGETLVAFISNTSRELFMGLVQLYLEWKLTTRVGNEQHSQQTGVLREIEETGIGELLAAMDANRVSKSGKLPSGAPTSKSEPTESGPSSLSGWPTLSDSGS